MGIIIKKGSHTEGYDEHNNSTVEQIGYVVGIDYTNGGMDWLINNEGGLATYRNSTCKKWKTIKSAERWIKKYYPKLTINDCDIFIRPYYRVTYNK